VKKKTVGFWPAQSNKSFSGRTRSKCKQNIYSHFFPFLPASCGRLEVVDRWFSSHLYLESMTSFQWWLAIPPGVFSSITQAASCTSSARSLSHTHQRGSPPHGEPSRLDPVIYPAPAGLARPCRVCARPPAMLPYQGESLTAPDGHTCGHHPQRHGTQYSMLRENCTKLLSAMVLRSPDSSRCDSDFQLWLRERPGLRPYGSNDAHTPWS
jgi:hypothetical protein